jgi:pSer/pThr/pTyr-binding forkhead associated (FHA) protein
MWKLTIEDDQANKTVVHLVRDEYSIGRAEENTIRLTERNISRRHARLAKDPEGAWVLSDLRSYNGCYVNGTRVSDHQPLAHGDLLQFGDYRLSLIDEEMTSGLDKAVTIPAAPRGHTLTGQPDRLVMVVGPSVGAEYPLSQSDTLVVGRGEECHISINHPSVSRVHAEIHPLQNGRYEVVDRESANGVRVNGVELPRSLLDARDVVELGDVLLKFIPAGEIYVPGSDENYHAFGGAALSTRPLGSFNALPLSVKVAVIAGAVGILGALGLAIASRSASQPTLAPSSERPDVATKLLAEAKALHARGEHDAAVRKASEVPEDSNVRQSAEFRKIYADWADAMFEKVSGTSDVGQKRELLGQVARATSVDSIRRKRAANDVAALAAESVDVTELPAAHEETQPTAKYTPPATPAPPSEKVEAPAVKVSTPATLVRKNPFDSPSESESPSSAQDLATSGDRAKLQQAKSLLQHKVQTGEASEREVKMLRALCRQLGDASCSH